MAAETPGAEQPADIVSRLRHRPLSLNQRLAAIAEELRFRNPDGAGVVDRFIARLEAAATGQDAPQVGEALPPFMMPDHQGRLVSLDGLLAQGPVVVMFYRGHWCPYCRMTMATLAEHRHRLAPARVVAVSAETQRYTRRIRAESQADFTFLSDMDAAYAASIGLAIMIESPLRELFAAIGHRIPDFQGSKGWVLPMPAVFVLGRDGLIKARHVDPDYRKRMEVDDLVAAIEGLGG